MGGYGSGYAVWRDRKATVEACRMLDIGTLVRGGALVPGSSGEFSWTNTATGERVAWIGFRVEGDTQGVLVLRLIYTITTCGGRHSVGEPVLLTRTYPNYGGARWWFQCPLIARGQACGRRAGKLYLPPGGRYFGCRHCYNLTYTSCQESHKFEAFHAQLGRDLGFSAREVKRILRDF